MLDSFEIKREDNSAGGRYVVYLPDGSEAEMTYRHTAPGVVSIDHTGVPPQFRSAGIALKLVEAGIEGARADGHKIVPLCSYVQAQFRRHPQWADLLA